MPDPQAREQNLRFQGQYLDRDTGLHYNTFRYYDPDIGRFISPDPIGLNGGINLSSYAPNPVGWSDALGLAGNWSIGGQPITAPVLPPYDGATTHGVFVYLNSNGSIQKIPLQSGGGTAYPNYANAGHVEGKSALFMREHGIQEGIVFHNNIEGTCGFCVNMTETLLPEGAKLTVVPPEGANPVKRGATGEVKTFTGNSSDPKQPTKKGC